MKIAIASEGKMVAGHFGHCEGFTLFEEQNSKILSREYIANPGHKPGFLPNFLEDRGVNVIIAGGMGQGALELFREKNIEVITGAAGEVENAAKGFIEGSLISTDSVCHEHSHSHECGH